MVGRIVRLISNDYTVLSENKRYVCKSCGKFRNQKISPLVGDMVRFDEANKYILEVSSRKNELVRPPVANIDQVFVITSCKEPDFSSNLLDKLLSIIEFNNIKPIICFTKMDLLKDLEISNINKVMDYYKEIGYTVYKNTELESIKKVFKNKITVFTGQTGSGKSTLLNNIDQSLKLKTGIISKALGRGKHTTRHVELLDLFDGLVADTPGFSAIIFIGMKDSDIRDNFIEFNEYKQLCKYQDCMHNNEPECEIKNLVKNGTILKSRYDNYIKFINRGE